MRGFRGRPDQVGRARSRNLADRFGRDLRLARLASGLTQRQLGALAQVSQPMVSQAERGDPHVSLVTRCRLAAACGHELGWRLYPVASISLRDSGQLRLAQFIVAAASPTWRVQLEAPVAPGDLRAADLLLRSDRELVHVEIERAPVDLQAQLRSAQLKREAIAAQQDLPVRLVVAFPDTRATRQRLSPFLDVLQRTFPVPSRRAWHAVRTFETVGGDAILLVRQRRIGPGSTSTPKAG